MGTRRQAREAALQLLYICDICNIGLDAIPQFFDSLELKDGCRDFALELFAGASTKIAELDRLIGEHTANWEMKRMAAVDRNILRFAAFEILEMPQTPINVIIDEAVEIAKRYSTADSSKFVNGILDKMKSIRKKTGN